MKRILQGFLGTIAVFALAVVAALVYLWPPHTPQEKIAKIRPGMTREEVLQILGEPYSRQGIHSNPKRPPIAEEWHYTRGFYEPYLVRFDLAGNVIER